VVQDDPTESGWLTLAEAGISLGCSVDTLRRRLKRGELEARQIPTRHGPAWQVRLGDMQGVVPTVGGMPTQPADSPGTVELVQLVGRLQQENRDLAGQVGFLQARLGMLEEQLALEAPREQPAPPELQAEPETVSGPAPAPWWRRWRRR
jgi:hypothetical protein